MKKVLAISGSLRSDSVNAIIISRIAEMFADRLHFNIYRGLGELPMFNPELDTDVPPPAVSHFRKSIREADGVLICTPEYVFSIPGALKSALEWTVSSSDFARKPTALITASSSGEKGHESLTLVLKTIEAAIGEDTALLIRTPKAKIAADGTITDQSTYDSITSVMEALIRAIN
jgi:NAD(P)H-dependent FMN reductase